MKLATIAKDIRLIARHRVGGINLKLELGERVGLDKDGLTWHSVNLETFPDQEGTDLFEFITNWERYEVAEDAELDFYCYARQHVGGESELVDNLGILVRGGRLVAWRLTGDGFNEDGSLRWHYV